MKEIFELYDVFENGTVVSKRSGKTLKGCVDSTGYVKVSPRINGIKYQLKVHRLIAIKFIPNPHNHPHVNHMDGNKENNHISNLEWCTSKYNIAHAFATGLSDNSHLKKKVYQINPMTNEMVNIFDSYREASQSTGILETNISACCRNYKAKNRPKCRQTAGGFKWVTCNDYPEREYTQVGGNG